MGGQGFADGATEERECESDRCLENCERRSSLHRRSSLQLRGGIRSCHVEALSRPSGAWTRNKSDHSPLKYRSVTSQFYSFESKKERKKLRKKEMFFVLV